jgi:hypothetical protein
MAIIVNLAVLLIITDLAPPFLQCRLQWARGDRIGVKGLARYGQLQRRKKRIDPGSGPLGMIHNPRARIQNHVLAVVLQRPGHNAGMDTSGRHREDIARSQRIPNRQFLGGVKRQTPVVCRIQHGIGSGMGHQRA